MTIEHIGKLPTLTASSQNEKYREAKGMCFNKCD